MAEREKVIKGLECCTFILGKRKCNECPYQKGLPDNGCYQLQDDFHALIKEQETAYQGAVELLRQKTILFDDAIKRLKEQEEIINRYQWEDGEPK